MKAKKRILLTVVSVGLMAALVAGGTFALFTDQLARKAEFAYGTVVLESDTDDGAIFPVRVELDNLAPGDYASGKIQVTNAGSLAAFVRLGDLIGEGAIFEDPVRVAGLMAGSGVRAVPLSEYSKAQFFPEGLKQELGLSGIGIQAFADDYMVYEFAGMQIIAESGYRRMAPGARGNINVFFYSPLELGNEFQGATGELTFLVQAVQARNNEALDEAGQKYPLYWSNDELPGMP